MMMKRLTAWLLVLCMTLSLLPGTAFAASGGGDDDGLITVYYDLNDGQSKYRLKMKTKPDTEPPINPGAVWAGRPFAGWAGDRAGSTAADISDGAVLYAMWQSGYKVTLNFGKDVKLEIPNGIGVKPDADNKVELTTDNESRIEATQLTDIQEIIDLTEENGDYAFAGWYADAAFRTPFDITGKIPTNGTNLYAKWIEVYEITLDYNKPLSNIEEAKIKTNGEGKLSETSIDGTPTAELISPTLEGYSFGGWYIIVTDPSQGREITEGSLDGERGIRIDNLATFDKFADYAKPDKTLTVTVNWAPPYHISYNTNWGDNPTVTVVDTNKDNMYVLPAIDPVRPGYTFIEWNTAKDGTGTTLKKAADDTNTTDTEFKPDGTSPTTIYAQWQEGYEIRFQLRGGKLSDAFWTGTDGKLTDDTLEKAQKFMNEEGQEFDGYVFEGWYVNGKRIDVNSIAMEIFTGPAIIVGQWSEGYLITFEANGGTLPGNKTVRTDTEGRLYFDGDYPNIPTREGYTFGGWYSDKELQTEVTAKREDAHTPPNYYDFTKSSTLYAEWTFPYTITLDANGGKVDITTLKTDEIDGNIFPTLPTPTREGYSFKGWYYDKAGIETKAEAGFKCEGPVTLTAKWGAPYIITLDANGGTVTPSTIKTTDADATTGEVKYQNLDAIKPTRNDTTTSTGTTKYTFLGWFTAAGGGAQIVDGNVCDNPCTLYAHWSETFTPAGGTTTKQNTPAAKPSTFAATRPSADVPSVTTVLPNGEFEIDLMPDGGTLEDGTAVTTRVTTTNQKLSAEQLPKLKKTDYEFVGWFSEEEGGIQITAGMTLDATVSTIYAHWEPIITFLPNGGIFPDAPTAFSKRLTTKNNRLPQWPEDPVREGWDFVNWLDGTTPITDKNHKFNVPTTLTANWKQSEYIVTFDRNDGTGTYTTAKVDASNGTVGTNWPDAPTRTGYKFDGWFTMTEGGDEVTGASIFTGNTTVYAHWTKLAVVTFDPDNGSPSLTLTVQEADNKLPSADLPIDDNAPKRIGYIFRGWFTAPNGGGNQFNKDSEFERDASFYAYWEKVEWTISWNTGSSPSEPTNPSTIAPSKTVGGYIPSLPQVTRKGYRFGGWWTGNPESTDPGIQVSTATPIYGDTTLTAKWIDLTNPPTPDNPVITFIVDSAPEGAAHFTLETNSSHQLEQLPVLDGVKEANGWRREKGTTRVTEAEVYNGNTNLYVYTAQTYSITFDWNDAEEGSSSNKTVIETNADGLIDLEKWPETDNARPGYHFDDWYTEATGGTAVSRYESFTEDTTIYAHWVGPYTITFDANGGVFPDGETKKEAETDAKGNLDRANIPEDPSREGYGSFVGWSLTADGTEAITPSGQPYEKATTLYAIWGPPYDITYDAMGGEVTPTEEQLKSTEEGKYPELPVPTHTRDSFGGWYTTQDYQEGTQATAGGDCPGAVTLYAKWTREPPYTITFVANREGATMEDPDSGAAVTTITLKTDDKGVLMKAPPEPMLRGGKFQGWFTKAEEGTGEAVTDAATRTYTDDTTLYAHWETMEFKITFDFNLSAIMSNPTNVTTYTTTKGGSLTYLPGDLPQASSGEKKISGWYRVPNPTAKDQPVTKSDVFYRDTTLYAQWVDADDPPIVFKYPNITFMNEDGNKAMITLEVDTDYKLATFPEPPYKEGHTFTGWVTRDPDGTEHPLTSDTLITGSLVAYPKYAQKGYTITFEPGEETELDPTKVTTTSEGRIPDGSMPDDPVWEGHTFNGWYTSATGGTKINRRTVFTQDTTVYAHWDGSDGETPSGEYTITFDADGGSATFTSAKTVNGKLKELPTATKSGYTFDGWYNGTSAVTVDTVYTADTTLKAHWKSDGGSDGPSSAPYTITFNPNGGNLETAATALTDLQGRLMSIPTPRRTGYSFDGWYNGTERVTTATVFTKNTEVVARWTTGSGGGSGSDSGTNGDNGYTVTVNNNSGGRVSVSTTYAREGDRVTVTIRPYTGYQLDQINVTNARGYDVSLRDQGGNRYTFYMPASRVTVDATFMELIANGNGNGDNGGNNGGNTGGNTGGSTGGNGGTGGTLNPITPPVTSGNGVFSEPVLNTVPMPYVDVTPSAWYYSSVDYMWQRSLMGGVSANRFGPQATTSNAMIWTILARLAGVDVTAGGGIWYENARSWAVSNRISDGVGPNNAVTREQLATMLWNYRGSPAASYDLGRFGDRGQISTYQAENALRWAVANNIVSGSGNRLNPRGTATRAEVAAMITRFCQNT